MLSRTANERPARRDERFATAHRLLVQGRDALIPVDARYVENLTLTPALGGQRKGRSYRLPWQEVNYWAETIARKASTTRESNWVPAHRASSSSAPAGSNASRKTRARVIVS
jgi:hypothetical protein